MADDTPILSLENVSISYFARAGEIPAVTDVSLTLRPGEAIGLVGESGCGKSTLAMAILRYLGGRGRVVAGRICYRGRDMASLSEAELRDIRGGGIGMVYQEAMSALNPSITVGEQLAEAVIYHGGGSTAQARQEVETMLKAVRLPDPGRIMAAYPHQLSGGQQQRVVIAMALLPKPDILLLDEPTTALDVTVEAGIVELIAELRARYGMTLVYISHNLGLIAQVCDRVAVMYSGEIVEEGPVATVFAKPRHPYTRGLIRCIPLPYVDRYARVLRAIPGQVTLPQERPSGCFFGPRCEHAQAGLCDVGRIALQPVRADHAVRCVRWRDVAESPESGEARPAEQRGDDAAIAVVDLDKTYTIDDRGLWGMLTGAKPRQIKANQKLNFRARQHQTLAIVGESGCGKTSFARVLMGLETASSGEIRFEGIDLGAVSVQARTPALLRSLQMVFQNPDETLNPSFTVGAQIARAVKKLGVGRNRAEVARRTSELLELTRLPAAFAMRRPRQLSGGQKQRVSIARAFAGNPTAVVADEPVSALDVSVRAAITDLLLDIQRKQGTTLIVISHDLGFVRYIADRVVVMYLGQVMEVGTAEQLFAPPYHPYTEALLAAVPVPEADVRKRRIVLSGELPSPIDPPKGCPFHTRCHRKLGAICENEKPPDQRLADNHRIVCHIPAAELAKVEPVFTRVPPAA